MDEKKPIPGYEGKYWIAEDGSVFNSENHKLKPVEAKGNVLQVELRKNGQRELIQIDVLLAITWR